MLILIPLFIYGLAFYNEKVDVARTWAEQHPSKLAELVLARVQRQPVPSQSLILLVSTLLLAVGATIYNLGCPSMVKEFSQDQWRHQLGHSLLHYWANAWRYPVARVICAAAYLIGGLGALFVLGSKLLKAGFYISQHSTFSLF